MRPERRPAASIIILYATETGTAARLAEDVQQRLEDQSIAVENVTDAREVDPMTILDRQDQADNRLVLILMSTGGRGEIPESCKHFWMGLLARAKLPEALYGFRPCSIFGLGDSRYPKFNWAAKKLYKLLRQEMNIEFPVPVALGDDSHEFSHFTELEVWIDDILTAVESPANSGDSFVYLLTPTGSAGALQEPAALLEERLCKHFSMAPARVRFSSEMTSADAVSPVKLIQLEIPVEYKAGDLLAILPICRNASNDFFGLLNWSPDKIPDEISLGLMKDQRRQNLCRGTNLHWIFSRILDLNAQPSRGFLLQMSRITDHDGIHRDKLAELGGRTVNEIAEYMRYIVAEKRSIYDVLVDFASSFSENPERLLEMVLLKCPILAPRKYSIAGSPKWTRYRSLERASIWRSDSESARLCRKIAANLPNTKSNKYLAELCVVLKQDKTFAQRIVTGVCSTYLHGLQVTSISKNDFCFQKDDFILVQVEKSGLSLNLDKVLAAERLLICATGTGVASVRGILQELWLFNSQGQTVNVFFGHRDPSQDWLFSKDWQVLSSETSNIKFEFAFSRKNDEYIQDVLNRNKPSFDVLIISGRSLPMPDQVLTIVGEKGLVLLETWG